MLVVSESLAQARVILPFCLSKWIARVCSRILRFFEETNILVEPRFDMVVVKELREYYELLAQELVGEVDLWRECGVSLRKN